MSLLTSFIAASAIPNLHTVRDEWGGTTTPSCPLRDRTGRVTSVRVIREGVLRGRPCGRRVHGGFVWRLARHLPRRYLSSTA